MKKLILILLASIVIVSCTNKVIKSDKNRTSEKEVISNSDNLHNASNSLDYLGVYIGIVPCADCSGIETAIKLSVENKFELTTKYLDKNDKGTTVNGTYQWNKEGNTVILLGLKEQPNQFFVGENQLIMLDMSGKKIEGQLADKYILKKQIITASQNSSLKGLKFKLIELNQKKIDSETNFYIHFADENRFSAFAGCNSMGGEYVIEKTYKIKFSKIFSTMKACEDMGNEAELSKVLEMVDNFNLNNNLLSLNKGRMTPFARFELIK